jgi:hypothetical protein
MVFEHHPSDDIIELYALGRLAEESIPAFEEHLLACAQCQDALHLEDSFSAGINDSLKRNRSGIRLV